MSSNWGVIELKGSENLGGAEPLVWSRAAVFPISSEKVTVGRGVNCNLRISKSLTWVSNRHFTVGRDATSCLVYVIDHSSNGTYVSWESAPVPTRNPVT